jgi:hypothetical protein
MNRDEISVEVAGTPVRAYRAGAGPALVLLHGGGLDDAQLTWAPVWARPHRTRPGGRARPAWLWR